MKEVDRIGDPVFNQHSLGIARYQLHDGGVQLIGDQDGRLLVPQLGDGDLAEFALVACKMDLAFQDPGVPVLPGQRRQSDPLPLLLRGGVDLGNHLLGAPAQADK